MQAIRKIKDLLAQFEKTKKVSPTDQHYLISQIRQVLEHKGYKQKYNIVNFYCNWTLHTNLSGSVQCFKMIEEIGGSLISAIGDNFSEDEAKHLTNIFIDTANKIFSVDILREQLIALFKEMGFSDFLFSDDNWLKFVRTLLEDIYDKKISYPEEISESFEPKSKLNKKAKESYMRLLESARAKRPDNYLRLVVTSIYISKNEDNKFTWNVQTIPQMKFTGLFTARDPKLTKGKKRGQVSY
jgi:hypothetical protein